MSFKDIDKLHERPGKIVVAGLAIILIFFGGLGSIAALMPFTGAVIAPGTVKVSQEKKTVQHLEGGIVDQIFVRQGDRVEKGDVLITLKSSKVNSSVKLLTGRLSTKMIEAARLEAQRDFRIDFEIPSNLPGDRDANLAIIKAERDVLQRTKLSLDGRIEIQDTRIRQLKEKIAGTEDELVATKKIVASLEEEIEVKSQLMVERYIDRSQILTLKRMLAEREGVKARLRQLMAESREEIEELKLSVASLKNDYQEKSASRLGVVRDEIFQLGQQLGPQKDAKERLDLRAPVTGIVMNLKIHSEQGGVLRPGEPVLDIVPEDAELIIECQLRQDKITSIHMGQETKVQLSAFNRITTSPVKGKISYISADSIMQTTPTGGQTSSYLVQVSVDKKELENNNAWLAPGMPAACYITMENRTFLQYLTEPILLNFDKSLRETL